MLIGIRRPYQRKQDGFIGLGFNLIRTANALSCLKGKLVTFKTALFG